VILLVALIILAYALASKTVSTMAILVGTLNHYLLCCRREALTRRLRNETAQP
jgi:hypothetical protein